MVSDQPDPIPQVTGDLTHARLWAATLFVDNYSKYWYAHLMRGTSGEETHRVKGYYKRLAATHGARVCVYKAESGKFSELKFKETVQTFRKQIIYCGVVSHHKNVIVDHRIKISILRSWNLLLHATWLWPEAVITMLWDFSFKTECQRYNILEMYEDEIMTEKNFYGEEFQCFCTDYHKRGCHVFVLKYPLQGGPAGIPKWEPRVRTRVYLGHPPFNAVSVALVLNTRTGHVYPQYHLVFDNTFSTVYHVRKVTVPWNCKSMVEKHSELATQ